MAVAEIGMAGWRAVLHLFVLLVLLVAAFIGTATASSGSSRSGVAKVGPAHNWLVPVSRQEATKIASKCSTIPAALRLSGTATTTTNATSNTVFLSEQRILDGERAPRGSFKYAATWAIRRAQIGDRWAATCGATFISRRHLLTAAHCISSQLAVSNSLTLLVGGVCLNGGGIDDCPWEADMVEAGIEFSISPYFHQSLWDGFKDELLDIAIVQLGAPVADAGKVESACLPDPNDPLPQYLTAFGWGNRGDSWREFYPNHLSYVEGTTQPLPQWTAGLDQRPECQPALTRQFCLFAVRGQRMNGTVYFGGWKWVEMGGNGWKWVEMGGNGFGNQEARYGGNVPPSRPAPDFTWAAALVDTGLDGGEAIRLVCTATLISSRHLLVSRFCLVGYMISHSRSQPSSISGKRNALRLQVAFELGANKTLYPVEFAAWLSASALEKGSTHSPENSELAILQLQAREGGDSVVDGNNHPPACVESDLNAGGYGNSEGTVEAVAYWWRGVGEAELRREVVKLSGKFEVVELSGKSENEIVVSDLLLVTRPPNATPADTDSIHNHGVGLMDTRNYRLLGLIAYQAGTNYHNYWHAWEYSGTLCLYLNVGCRPNRQSGASFVDNRIPYFNRFLYFD